MGYECAVLSDKVLSIYHLMMILSSETHLVLTKSPLSPLLHMALGAAETWPRGPYREVREGPGAVVCSLALYRKIC